MIAAPAKWKKEWKQQQIAAELNTELYECSLSGETSEWGGMSIEVNV